DAFTALALTVVHAGSAARRIAIGAKRQPVEAVPVARTPPPIEWARPMRRITLLVTNDRLVFSGIGVPAPRADHPDAPRHRPGELPVQPPDVAQILGKTHQMTNQLSARVRTAFLGGGHAPLPCSFDRTTGAA